MEQTLQMELAFFYHKNQSFVIYTYNELKSLKLLLSNSLLNPPVISVIFLGIFLNI